MIERAVLSLLSAAGDLTALVDTRIYSFIPQKPTYPYVSYSVDEGTEDSSFDGQGTLQEIDLEVDAWATSHSGLPALAAAAKAALKNYSGTVEGIIIDQIRIDGVVTVYEEHVKAYRRTITATIFKR